MRKKLGKIKNIFKIKKEGMGIKELMGIKDKDDAEAFKCSGTKSFESNNNIFISKVKK